jgi:hypothetical protein
LTITFEPAKYKTTFNAPVRELEHGVSYNIQYSLQSFGRVIPASEPGAPSGKSSSFITSLFGGEKREKVFSRAVRSFLLTEMQVVAP